MSEKNWKDNHMFVSLTMMAVVAAGITAIGTISGAYDAGHTSEAELQAVVQMVQTNSLERKCDALSIKISLAEQAIWQMEQANDTGQRLIEKKRELRRLIAQFNEASCASVLAG